MKSKSIPPNGKVALTLLSSIRGRAGEFTSDCTLRLSDGSARQLKLKTVIYERLAFEPSEFYLGGVIAGERVGREFVIVAHSRGAIEFDGKWEAKPSIGAFTVDFDAARCETLPDGMTRMRVPGRFAITAAPTAGSASCELAASVRTKEGKFAASMALHWIVECDYTFEPTSVFVGRGSSAEGRQFPIVMTHAAGRDFALLRAESRGVKVSCSVALIVAVPPW